MASGRDWDLGEDVEEEGDGMVTPSPVSPTMARASTASHDEFTRVAGLPQQSIRWSGLSANTTTLRKKDTNGSSDGDDISPTSVRRAAATPPPTSYHYGSSHPDYFALQVPRSSTPAQGPTGQRSSTSLQSLSEHTDPGSSHSLRRAPSNVSNRSLNLTRRVSHSKSSSTSLVPAKSPNSEHPVYPDQSFASLQNQFYPSRPAPVLRTRSSNPAPNLLYGDMAGTSRSSRTQPNPSPAAMTAGNTPISSPGLFSPSPRPQTSDRSQDNSRSNSPLLHPAHTQKPKVTHTAEIDRDMFTGNKYINEYEILGELGRGEHGKVKLGRRMGEETRVAIKIVPRYSKRRRLGKLGAPEDNTKREVAVLKKARHPNVVSLLEVIDDPAKNKVYLVLEYVEFGEIKWRKKAPSEILGINNSRMGKNQQGSTLSLEPTEFEQVAVSKARRRHEKLQERAQAAVMAPVPKWSLEHSADTDEEYDSPELSKPVSRQYSRSNVPSRTGSNDDYNFSSEPPLAGSMYGAYATDAYRGRAMSIAASTASHMSSEFEFAFDENSDQYGYVPALTFDECRSAVRDTLLGLEFLHYIGIVHRDIKPMNLLVGAHSVVKISDFGVSYLGRPVSDEEEDTAIEAEAETLDDPKELAKSVGTPGFWAPEMCYDIMDPAQVAIYEKEGKPKITNAIDLWSLGVTLYGMVYARLPFYEVDHRMNLYEAICKSEPFIPKTRLVPVDTSASEPNLKAPEVMNSNKRLDYELKFETVPESLRDFIAQLLIKDPDRRMTIASAKKHPWVLEGITDPSQWLKTVNPDKKKRSDILEVDEKELSHAVIKRSIVERALSGVSRIAGSFLGRRDVRKRARSTATSASASSDSIASPSASSGSTVGKGEKSKEGRRTSLRGDEVIAAALKASREGPEHPLAQSQTASPDEKATATYFDDSVNTKAASTGVTPGVEQERRPPGPERAISSVSTAESVMTIRASQYAKRPSVFDPPPQETQTDTSNLLEAASTSLHGLFSGARKGLAGMRSRERRPHGNDRSLSPSRTGSESDAHAEPSVAMSTASASGDFEYPDALREEELVVEEMRPTLRLSPTSANSDRRASHIHAPESSETAFEQAQAMNRRRHIQEAQLEAEKVASRAESNAASYECPPSPDDDVYLQKVKTAMQEASPTTGIATLPSASTIASSEDFGNSSVSQSMSNPSIGAISGASSPPNDPFLRASKEELLGHGSDTLPDFMRTADTITAHGRPVIAAGKPLEQQAEYDDGDNEAEDYDDEESSGDEGLLMMGGGSRPGGRNA